jgi:hypothetical protein
MNISTKPLNNKPRESAPIVGIAIAWGIGLAGLAVVLLCVL